MSTKRYHLSMDTNDHYLHVCQRVSVPEKSTYLRESCTGSGNPPFHMMANQDDGQDALLHSEEEHSRYAGARREIFQILEELVQWRLKERGLKSD